MHRITVNGVNYGLPQGWEDCVRTIEVQDTYLRDNIAGTLKYCDDALFAVLSRAPICDKHQIVFEIFEGSTWNTFGTAEVTGLQLSFDAKERSVTFSLESRTAVSEIIKKASEDVESGAALYPFLFQYLSGSWFPELTPLPSAPHISVREIIANIASQHYALSVIDDQVFGAAADDFQQNVWEIEFSGTGTGTNWELVIETELGSRFEVTIPTTRTNAQAASECAKALLSVVWNAGKIEFQPNEIVHRLSKCEVSGSTLTVYADYPFTATLFIDGGDISACTEVDEFVYSIKGLALSDELKKNRFNNSWQQLLEAVNAVTPILVIEDGILVKIRHWKEIMLDLAYSRSILPERRVVQTIDTDHVTSRVIASRGFSPKTDSLSSWKWYGGDKEAHIGIDAGGQPVSQSGQFTMFGLLEIVNSGAFGLQQVHIEFLIDAVVVNSYYGAFPTGTYQIPVEDVIGSGTFCGDHTLPTNVTFRLGAGSGAAISGGVGDVWFRYGVQCQTAPEFKDENAEMSLPEFVGCSGQQSKEVASQWCMSTGIPQTQVATGVEEYGAMFANILRNDFAECNRFQRQVYLGLPNAIPPECGCFDEVFTDLYIYNALLQPPYSIMRWRDVYPTYSNVRGYKFVAAVNSSGDVSSYQRYGSTTLLSGQHTRVKSYAFDACESYEDFEATKDDLSATVSVPGFGGAFEAVIVKAQRKFKSGKTQYLVLAESNIAAQAFNEYTFDDISLS